MTYDPDRHHRRSTRLLGYDYTAAATYFLTLCTDGRTHLFGDIIAGDVALNECGRVVHDEWHRSANIRPSLRLDAVVVMPNHLHGLITFTEPDTTPNAPIVPNLGRAHGCAPLRRSPRSLGSFVAGFKAATTNRINLLRGTPGAPVWQRNYHDHIVRNDDAYARIYNYILTNPLRWHLDRDNPDRWANDDFDTWLATTAPQSRPPPGSPTS